MLGSWSVFDSVFDGFFKAPFENYRLMWFPPSSSTQNSANIWIAAIEYMPIKQFSLIYKVFESHACDLYNTEIQVMVIQGSMK